MPVKIKIKSFFPEHFFPLHRHSTIKLQFERVKNCSWNHTVSTKVIQEIHKIVVFHAGYKKSEQMQKIPHFWVVGSRNAFEQPSLISWNSKYRSRQYYESKVLHNSKVSWFSMAHCFWKANHFGTRSYRMSYPHSIRFFWYLQS